MLPSLPSLQERTILLKFGDYDSILVAAAADWLNILFKHGSIAMDLPAFVFHLHD